MPSNSSTPLPTYTIFIDGRTRRGTARDLLEQIRSDAASRSGEIARMNAERYASLIVKDAAFFLNRDLLAVLEREDYVTEYDRALRYLSEMDASGVRILTRQEANH